ncbi:hypothetical protein [Dyadobacter psychrophilus]|uniref:Uncharacterized protein n=1 Tax=Dyadobacter psychrophilus TaxID=651661 RepID=A0A1T5GYT3_9BACT|nr:hypothetical protein [Dyadobacter psychrophilus]SKC13574.1 hypothetical protein SAMN05660293_04606 [Dyadobacter psychrophilus]
MKTSEFKNSKGVTVVVNKELNKLRGREFFPEKLKKVNEILAKSGLPKLDR